LTFVGQAEIINRTHSSLCTIVWKRIKGSKPEGSKKDQIEEFEDSEGNVFNKKTYEDLKRQGLI